MSRDDLRRTSFPSPASATLSARRFEEWKHSYINVLGLGAAARYALGLDLDAWGLALAEWRSSYAPGHGLRDLGPRQVRSAPRISPHYFTGADELEVLKDPLLLAVV